MLDNSRDVHLRIFTHVHLRSSSGMHNMLCFASLQSTVVKHMAVYMEHVIHQPQPVGSLPLAQNVWFMYICFSTCTFALSFYIGLQQLSALHL